MKLHRNSRSRLLLETLEDRITPSGGWNQVLNKFAAPADQTPVQAAFEIKDFSFGVENPTTIGSATKIDWSGPGDEGPEESITFGAGKIKFNEFTIKRTSAPALAGWNQVTNKADNLADQTPVPAAVDAFIWFASVNGHEDPVLAGWNQVVNKSTALADQAPVPAAMDIHLD